MLIATFAWFGAWDTLVAGIPAALWVCAPALLCLRYTRRRPTRRRGRLVGALLGLLTVAMILVSPICFWSGPVLLVLCSEAARLAVASTAARVATARRRRRAGVAAAARSTR